MRLLWYLCYILKINELILFCFFCWDETHLPVKNDGAFRR